MTEELTTYTFRTDSIELPSIYEPASLEVGDTEKQFYGLSIYIEELPTVLDEYVKPRYVQRPGFLKYPEQDHRIYIKSNKPPMVVCDRGGDLSTTLRCAIAANIHPDQLLRGIPAELAVSPFTYTSHRKKSISALSLLAIKVRHADMIDRYDEILKRSFE